MKRNLSIKQTAELLNCSISSVYRLLDDGEILAFRVRGSLRIAEESLELYRMRQISKYLDENAITLSECARTSQDFLTGALDAFNDETKKNEGA